MKILRFAGALAMLAALAAIVPRAAPPPDQPAFASLGAPQALTLGAVELVVATPGSIALTIEQAVSAAERISARSPTAIARPTDACEHAIALAMCESRLRGLPYDLTARSGQLTQAVPSNALEPLIGSRLRV